MTNNIKVRALYQESNKGWYLDITPPLHFSGGTATQDGTLYFENVFDSKEQAYEQARKELLSRGVPQEIIDSRIDYE